MIDINSGDGQGPECADALRYMYEFLDKELTEVDKAHVQEHLDNCLPCLEQFEFEEELKRVIIHGVLHLCGYKDKTSKDSALMRKKENWALKKFEKE